MESISLLIIVILLVLHDVEEPKLIDALARANNTEPITQLLLLQELLGEVLEVATRELDVSHDLDFVAAHLGDGNVVAEVAGAAVDLDAVVQELLEGGDVEDLVGDGLGAVDGVLFALSQLIEWLNEQR